jgi:hypothetical protein
MKTLEDHFNYFWAELRKTWDGLTPTHKMIEQAFYAGYMSKVAEDLEDLKKKAKKGKAK